MSEGQAAVARATAAVFIDGWRAGSAVLVGPRYLVTAAHVLQRQDPRTLATVAVEQAELEFPAQRPGGQPGTTAAVRIDLGQASVGIDVAVLDLGEDRPGWLPTPVPVWPAARPPTRVQVFGYPLAERLLKGVWRQFTVAGPTTAGAVQLDWIGDAGSFPGHSGGPVIDAAGHALVGILVEGAERGRFDRYLPVTLIARVWPRLPRPWLMAGTEPDEPRSHFTRRARGQRSAARGGDLFRGRQVALDRTREWLTAVRAPGQPLVITGQPGAGKSAVLARAALSVEADNGGPGLAFHARAATIGDFLTALADLTGIDTPTSADELVTGLADLRGPSPVPVVLDALDEAASDRDRRQITEVLAELAVLPWLRVSVATRTMAASNPFAPGGLLPSLGVATRDDHNLIDLDRDTYFDLDGLRQFAAALLAQDGMDRPSPPGAAWTQYRTRHAVRDRLAAIIAERAGRNFLVAAMAAVPLSTARTVTDPAAKGFDPAGIPSGVGEALSKYLDRLPDQRRERDRGLLTALAYARGTGVDDPAWLAFAAALGYDATVPDLDALRRSPAADYLLQTTTAEHGTRPVTRLFHRALTDELLAARHQPSDESALLDMLFGQAARSGWNDRYLCEHAAEHAAASGRLDQLLEDPLYLLHADLRRLIPMTSHATTERGRDRAQLLRLTPQTITASSTERAALFSITEALEHLGTSYRHGTWRTPYIAVWSSTSRRRQSMTLVGHRERVHAICPVTVSGRTLLASGGDRTVRIWDPAIGELVTTLTGHTETVNTICPIAVGGRDLLASGSYDSAVRVWNPATGQQLAILIGHVGAVRSVCPVIISGYEFLVSGGEDGTIRIWDPLTAQNLGTLNGHTRAVTAVCPITVDGQNLLASGGHDRTVRIWDPVTGELMATLEGRQGGIWSVCPVTVGGRDLLASGGGSGTVRIWDPATGELLATLKGHTGTVNVVCPVTFGGQNLLASGGVDETVRIWDPIAGRQVALIHVHHDKVYAVCPIAVGGRDLLASGGRDSTVRFWDPATWREVAIPEGDPTTVNALCPITVGERNLLVGGGGTVRIWDPATGELVATLEGHRYGVNAVCPIAVGGRDLLATATTDHTVRIWDPATGELVATLEGHRYGRVNALCPIAVGGRDLLASGGDDDTVRIWDPATWQQLATMEGRSGISGVDTICRAKVGDRELLASGGRLTIGFWDPATGHRTPSWYIGRNRIRSLCPVIVGGRELVASGVDDRTVGIWDPATGKQLATLEGHHGVVNAVCQVTVGDRALLASASDDRTVRVWDPRARRCLLAIPVHYPALAIAEVAGRLAIGLDAGVLVIKLTPET